MAKCEFTTIKRALFIKGVECDISKFLNKSHFSTETNFLINLNYEISYFLFNE